MFKQVHKYDKTTFYLAFEYMDTSLKIFLQTLQKILEIGFK